MWIPPSTTTTTTEHYKDRGPSRGDGGFDAEREDEDGDGDGDGDVDGGDGDDDGDDQEATDEPVRVTEAPKTEAPTTGTLATLPTPQESCALPMIPAVPDNFKNVYRLGKNIFLETFLKYPVLITS